MECGRDKERYSETKRYAVSRKRSGTTKEARWRDFGGYHGGEGWCTQDLRVVLTSNSKHAPSIPARNIVSSYFRRNASPTLEQPPGRHRPARRDRLTRDDILFAKSPDCRLPLLLILCAQEFLSSVRHVAARRPDFTALIILFSLSLFLFFFLSIFLGTLYFSFVFL